jgi:hypothetical protein
VLSAAKDANIAVEIHVVYPSLEEVKNKVNEGFRFIAYNTDAILLNSKCREAASELKLLHDKKPGD